MRPFNFLRGDRNVPPDSCAHVTATGREQIVRGAGGNRDNCVAVLAKTSPSSRALKRRLTGVLVSLEHHLRITGDRVPELDASVLRATHNPVSVWSQANAEHKVLSRKC